MRSSLRGKRTAVQSLWRISVDPQTLRWVDGPERLTAGAELDDHITISPDGRKLAFSRRTERTKLWSFPFDNAGGRLTPVLARLSPAEVIRTRPTTFRLTVA